MHLSIVLGWKVWVELLYYHQHKPLILRLFMWDWSWVMHLLSTFFYVARTPFTVHSLKNKTLLTEISLSWVTKISPFSVMLINETFAKIFLSCVWTDFQVFFVKSLLGTKRSRSNPVKANTDTWAKKRLQRPQGRSRSWVNKSLPNAPSSVKRM